MKFRVTINAIVEADNLDDVFSKLENHFKFLQEGENDPEIFSPGSELNIEKDED